MTSPHPAARIARLFLVTAIVLVIGGMALGVFMGVANDHRLGGVHAHVNLIGFVTMFLAGLFYRLFPEAAGRFALVHYGLMVGGLAFTAPGIAGSILAIPAIAWMVIPGSLTVFAGTLLFLWIVIRATGRPPQEATAASEQLLAAARPRAA